MGNETLTAIKGVRVGHATSPDALTGFTAVLFDGSFPVGYCSHGGGPSTFNTETLRNGKAFNLRHGLFVTGGSLSGLMAVTPLMQAMIDDGIGDRYGAMVNPSLSGAVVFDLGIGVDQYDPAHGNIAYQALSAEPVVAGNVGAGTGTSVGKFHRPSDAGDARFAPSKAGVGNARVDLGSGGIVCAMTVVNALGNVVSRDGSILAGNLRGDGEEGFISAQEAMALRGDLAVGEGTATTVSIVGTNLSLGNRENHERVATLAAQGHVRALDPVNCFADGDTVFVFSTGGVEGLPFSGPGVFGERLEDAFVIDVIGQAAAEAVRESIYDACLKAETVSAPEAYRGVVPAIQ